MGGLGSLSKAAIGVVLNISEWLLIVGGVVLVIGLIGELKTGDKHRDSQQLWYKRFEWMVIIGVAVELIADGGIFLSSRRLQSIADEELTVANEQIMHLAPRYWWLSMERKKRVAALTPFANQKVVVLECSFVAPMDAEIPALAMNIASLLDESDWLNPWGEPILLPDHTDKRATSHMFNKIDFRSTDKGRCSQRIFVEIPTNAPLRVRNAATELSREIMGVDLGRLNWPWPSFLPSADDIIIVSVGIKGV